MNLLNRKTADQPKTLPLKVMQFGGGNFLRAFVDWMVQVLNKETEFDGGIAIIKPTERGDYNALKSQDGLFTVVLDGIKNGELIAEQTLITAVQKIINCYTQWEAYLDLSKNEDIRFIVSNTTEAGIKFSAEDAFEDRPPKEFPAKLTVWLYHRYLHFKGDTTKGCILLPCELIEGNGDLLKKTILKYATQWELDSAFSLWINEANHFCNTLVDRIVSGYPKDRAKSLQAALGYEDSLMVAGEYYHSWVIQGPEIVREELPFSKTGLNVSFVSDLAPSREKKVRILNGAHTAMVPVAYLSGIRYVKEAMEDPELSYFISSLLSEEVAKTLDFTQPVIQQYIQDVKDRFRNPLLKHQLINIALNSCSKFVTRLLPSLKDYYNLEGILPQKIVFALAALILFYKGTSHNKKINLKDDPEVLEFFEVTWKNLNSAAIDMEQLVQAILQNTEIWKEDLTQIRGLAKQVTSNLINIENIGIKEALTTINKGNITA